MFGCVCGGGGVFVGERVCLCVGVVCVCVL